MQKPDRFHETQELLVSMENPTAEESRIGTLHSHRSLKFSAQLYTIAELKELPPPGIKGSVRICGISHEWVS